MSRIGNKHILLPAGVTVEFNNKDVKVNGPKGSLSYTIDSLIDVKLEGTTLICTRPNDEKYTRSIHGTTRALLNNMVKGVSEGFVKDLEIVGVGYRASLKKVDGKDALSVEAGFKDPRVMIIPEGLKVTCPKPEAIHIEGIDKQLIGQFASEIRSIRKPEPYKGKGIKYADEHIRRKEGKKAK